ncbi:MAG: hypothetical protein HQM08_01730 [Candidatus Riflebacteria bacterium]|nr:hypothetical protein [Candidatus Riflebacteria bacterium]
MFTRKRLLLIFTVIPLLLLLSGSYYLVSTNSGAVWAFDYLSTLLSQRQIASIKTDKINGNLLEGIKLDTLSVSLPESHTIIQLTDIFLLPELSALLNGYFRVAQLEVGSARIIGPGKIQQRIDHFFEENPRFNEIGCFAFPNEKIRIAQAHINKCDWLPASYGVRIQIFDLHLTPSEEKGFQQDLIGSISGNIGKTELFSGKFDGKLKGSTLESKLSGQILGINFHNDFQFTYSPSLKRLEGTVKIDEFSFQNALKPFEKFWLDKFPVQILGKGSLSGSWLYDWEIGVSGAIKGVLNNFSLVITGLNIPLFLLNLDLELKDREIEITNKQSSIFGFNADISGKAFFDNDNNFGANISASSTEMILENFLASMPWALKFGLGLPEMIGTAALKINCSGKPPALSFSFKCPDAELKQGNFLGNWSCSIEGKHDLKTMLPPKIVSKISWVARTPPTCFLLPNKVKNNPSISGNDEKVLFECEVENALNQSDFTGNATFSYGEVDFQTKFRASGSNGNWTSISSTLDAGNADNYKFLLETLNKLKPAQIFTWTGLK